jgi:hypothetical protein
VTVYISRQRPIHSHVIVGTMAALIQEHPISRVGALVESVQPLWNMGAAANSSEL